jgi:hypothetical protein
MPTLIAPSTTLQFSLSDDPRTRFPDWYKDVCKASSTLLSHLDEAGGLFMVCNDDMWNTHPGNLTNTADVISNGDAPAYRARPDFSNRSPTRTTPTVAAALSLLYKQALDAHVAVARAALTAALLDSIGSDNNTSLEATMYPVPVYSLSPRQIIAAMFTKRDQTSY